MTKEIDKNGNTLYYNEQGQFHREDGPAVVWADGRKEYWIDDELHRVDGPAVVCADGDKYWFKHGQKHREDGPAIEFAEYKAWYHHDKLHREDGPAEEFACGCKEYWINGKHIEEVSE